MSTLATAALLTAGLKLVVSHAPYPDGAPAGFSGGFKEDSCQACHFSQELNAAPGRVVLIAPPAYEAGKTYTVTITLHREDMKLAGFQLTARFKDTGAQAGSLEPAAADRDRVGISDDGKVKYAVQKKAGSTITTAGTATWTLAWTAPSSGGAVMFHVAANAADGDGTTGGGDFIYTASAEAAPSHLVLNSAVKRVPSAAITVTW